MPLKLLPEAMRSRLVHLYVDYQKTRRERRADVLLISFAKSGRTWLRVMLGKTIADHRGFDGVALGYAAEYGACAAPIRWREIPGLWNGSASFAGQPRAPSHESAKVDFEVDKVIPERQRTMTDSHAAL